MERKKKKVSPGFDIRDFINRDNLPLICLVALAIFVVVSIVVSHVSFGINIVVACVMVLLEAGLAVCFNRIPIWVHGLIFIAQIVMGIMASQLPFMIFMALIYVFAIAFLYVWANR